jgi:membrane-associated phospholipid phosphatase
MPPFAGFVLCLLVLAPGSAMAQERPFPYALTRGDAVNAPAGVVAGAFGIYLAGEVDPLTLAEITGLDRANVNGLDRGATYNWSPTWQDRSDHPRNLLLVAAAAVAGGPLVLKGRWSETATMGVIFLEAASLTAAATYVTKGLAARIRPFAYNTSLTPEERYAIAGENDPGARQSFFSGHASSSFAAAALLSTVYTDMYGSSTSSKIVWISSLSLASLTAYGRVKGGVHFPTDVMTGAVVGTIIGRMVPVLHRVDADRRLSISAGPGTVQFSLAVGGR